MRHVKLAVGVGVVALAIGAVSGTSKATRSCAI